MHCCGNDTTNKITEQGYGEFYIYVHIGIITL